MTSTRRDQVRGILLGLAAGDRNGGPLRMAVRLAESLVATRRFDRADILDRYLAWWQAGAFDTGPVAAQVLRLVTAGLPAAEAVARVHYTSGGRTAGCNPAHRAPPLAMAAFLADDTLASVAAAEAALTHGDPLAGDVAGAVVRLCRALVWGDDWELACQRAASGHLPETRAAWEARATPPASRDGFAPAVFQAALAVLQRSQNFSEALEAALTFAGPSNYCPVIVGAVGGARWGATAIPPTAVAHCTVLGRVEQVSAALADDWAET